jgi:lactoylglutathione lyase
MYKRIDHLALHVSDLRRSIAFYETRFGFENYFEHPIPSGQTIAYLRLGDTVLEILARPDEPVSGFHFCLEVDDFDAAVATLTAAGVPLVTPPHNTAARAPREEAWRRVVFAGPDGEQIELRG